MQSGGRTLPGNSMSEQLVGSSEERGPAHMRSQTQPAVQTYKPAELREFRKAQQEVTDQRARTQLTPVKRGDRRGTTISTVTPRDSNVHAGAESSESRASLSLASHSDPTAIVCSQSESALPSASTASSSQHTPACSTSLALVSTASSLSQSLSSSRTGSICSAVSSSGYSTQATPCLLTSRSESATSLERKRKHRTGTAESGTGTAEADTSKEDKEDSDQEKPVLKRPSSDNATTSTPVRSDSGANKNNSSGKHALTRGQSAPGSVVTEDTKEADEEAEDEASVVHTDEQHSAQKEEPMDQDVVELKGQDTPTERKELHESEEKGYKEKEEDADESEEEKDTEPKDEIRYSSLLFLIYLFYGLA